MNIPNLKRVVSEIQSSSHFFPMETQQGPVDIAYSSRAGAESPFYLQCLGYQSNQIEDL